jgi:hypothetical protein
LPDKIDGHRRNTVICRYQHWKGTSYMLINAHCVIKWSVDNLMEKVTEINNVGGQLRY